MLTSPVVDAARVGGPGRRSWPLVSAAAAPLLALALAGGVFASDAIQYHASNLAPTARYEELAQVNSRFAGRGPTLFTDFDEYSLYGLRDLDVGGPNFIYPPPALAADRGGLPLPGRTRSPPAGGPALLPADRHPPRPGGQPPPVGLPPALARAPTTRCGAADAGAPAAIADIAPLGPTSPAVRSHRAPGSARGGSIVRTWSLPGSPELLRISLTHASHPARWGHLREGLVMSTPGRLLSRIRGASRRCLGSVAPGPDHARGRGER